MEFRDMNEPQTIIFHRLIKDFYIINGKVIYKGMNYPELDRLLVSKDNSRSIMTLRRMILGQLCEVEFPMFASDEDDEPIVRKVQFTDVFQEEDISNVLKAHRYYDGEMKNTPRTFGAALKYHMEQRAMSAAELSEITKIAEATISKMVNEDESEEKHRSTKNVVAMCIALKLPPRMSYNLLDLAGCKLMNNAQDRAYSFVLDLLYQFPLELCDGIIRQLGTSSLIVERLK